MSSLVDEMKKTGLSVLKISKETGIPSARMYKWIAGEGSPKGEDSEILRKWLDKKAGNLEVLPNNDAYKDKYIALLEQQVNVLNQAIQSNLVALSHGQEYLSAYVKAAVTRDAERYVKDDPRKKVEEMNKIDRIFLQIVEGKQTGTPAGIQGKG